MQTSPQARSTGGADGAPQGHADFPTSLRGAHGQAPFIIQVVGALLGASTASDNIYRRQSPGPSSKSFRTKCNPRYTERHPQARFRNRPDTGHAAGQGSAQLRPAEGGKTIS